MREQKLAQVPINQFISPPIDQSKHQPMNQSINGENDLRVQGLFSTVLSSDRYPEAGPVRHCSERRRHASRGTAVQSEQPQPGLLRYLCSNLSFALVRGCPPLVPLQELCSPTPQVGAF